MLSNIKNNLIKSILFFTTIIFIFLLLSLFIFKIYIKDILYILISLVPYLLFTIFFSVGVITKKNKIENKTYNNKFEFIFAIIGVFIVLINYLAMISYYGSIENIITNAFLIREELIGSSISITPFWTGYLFALVFSFFALHLSKNLYYGSISKKFCILIFIIILCNDFLTFGRVGTTIAILMIVVYFSVKFGPLIFFNFTNFLWGLLLFFFVNLPRLIRGNFDNFENSIEVQFNDGIYLPEFLNGFYSFLIYATQSFVTFGYAYQLHEHDFLLGRRNFLPIINIFGKIFGVDYQSRIDPFVYIPFQANLYGAGWDFYLDFGFLGLFCIPVFYGFSSARLILSNNLNLRAAGIYLCAAYIFWPFYNIFTFGTHFIALSFLFIMYLLSKKNKF